MSSDEVMNAIDDVLRALGPNTSKVILFHTEHRFGLKPSEIPFKPAEFRKTLNALLGGFAPVIEASICKQLTKNNPNHSSEFLNYLTQKPQEMNAI